MKSIRCSLEPSRGGGLPLLMASSNRNRKTVFRFVDLMFNRLAIQKEKNMCCIQNNNNRLMEKVATAFPALVGRLTCIALVAMAAALLPQNSGAATPLYWDANGSAAGASPGGGLATGTWGVNNFWNTDSAGGLPGPGAWVANSLAVFSAGSDATGTFTVTLNGTQTAGGVTFEEGTVTLSGDQLTLSGPITVNAPPTKAIISSVIGGSAGLTKLNTGEVARASAT